MSNWPGAGAAITLVYEARQGVNKERMISRRKVGHLHIVTMLGLSWPHFHLRTTFSQLLAAVHVVRA